MRTTYMAKISQIEKKWHLVDATNIPLGRISTVLASLLMGKKKTIYTPHLDTGDFVIVINADKVKLTGKKLVNKIYYRHSNFPGGLKSISAGDLLIKNSSLLIKMSVKGMLQKNKLGRIQLSKLNIYPGKDHPHEAQQPTLLNIKNLI